MNDLRASSSLFSKRLNLLSENFPLTGLPNVNSSPNFRSNIFSGDAQRHELHPGTHVVEGNFGVFQPHQLESIDTPVNYLTPKRNTDSVHSSTEHIDRYLVPRVIDSPDQLLVSELQTLRLSFSSVISSSQSIITHSDDEGFHDSHSAAGILIVKFSSGMLLSCFELFQAISGLSLFTNSSADSMRHIKFITSSILSSISQLQGVIENIKHEFHELENLHAQRLGKKIQQHCQNINARKLKFTFHKWSMTTTCMLQAKQKDSSKEMFSILSNVQTQKFNAIHSKWKRELGDKKFLLWKLALLQKSVTCLKSNWFESKKLMANSMKVVYRIMNMHVARCFTQWMDHLRTMKKVKKCMGVLLKKSMVCCFYAWQEYATDKKETSKRLQAAARKILGKWMHGGVSRAFERWLRFAQEEKKLRAKCKTVVYRISNIIASRCISVWICFVQSSKRASWLLTRAYSLSIKQSHLFHRVRILSLGLHFHFFRRHFKTRRSLSFRLRYKGYSLLRSYFSTWFTHIHAVKIQRDDEFTVSVLKSVSNFPLQHYLEEHAAKRIHSSRTQFCRSFEKQLELMQEKASSFNFLQSVSC
jgi:hypothetical protein